MLGAMEANEPSAVPDPGRDPGGAAEARGTDGVIRAPSAQSRGITNKDFLRNMKSASWVREMLAHHDGFSSNNVARLRNLQTMAKTTPDPLHSDSYL
jgi:hypothetical protein